MDKTFNYHHTGLLKKVDLAVAQEKNPCWITLIQEILDVYGYSSSRIAYRVGSSPSTIQKLLKNHSRSPRDKLFFNLCRFYYKLFYSDHCLEKASKFVSETKDETLCQLIIELIMRDFYEENSQKKINVGNTLLKIVLDKEKNQPRVFHFNFSLKKSQLTKNELN